MPGEILSARLLRATQVVGVCGGQRDVKTGSGGSLRHSLPELHDGGGGVWVDGLVDGGVPPQEFHAVF